MTTPEKTRFIALNEIDENIIPKVRDLNEHSDVFKILTNSIKQDRQRHPITLRRLTALEKSNAKPEALYGIIDGHHRYRIAYDTNQSDILSTVINESNEEKSNAFDDLKLALRLNEGSIKMSPTEKGKVLYEMMRTTELDLSCLAEELFGIKTSMAYSCINSYKKSIGEKVIAKPRSLPAFELKQLKKSWAKLSKVKVIPQSVEDCLSCLDDIITLEKELRKYKQVLLATDGVKLALAQRKSS